MKKKKIIPKEIEKNNSAKKLKEKFAKKTTKKTLKKKESLFVRFKKKLPFIGRKKAEIIFRAELPKEVAEQSENGQSQEKTSTNDSEAIGGNNQAVEKKVDNLPEVSVGEAAKKPRVAIVSLTSCEGCQFVLLDLGERFLELTKKIELVDFRLIEDEEDMGESIDLALVEGNPVTKENLETLKHIRSRAKILAALGNCAAMGGIPEIKNYQERNNTVKHVYRYLQGISNPEIREIDNFVKVDFVFPGCPIDGEEFLKYISILLQGNIPQIPDSPVCVECKKAGNRCLLLDKKPCFGPMILGGCNAVCPSSRMGCQGCRGLRPTGNVKAMKMALKNMMTDEEFENTTEIYGLRDDIEERSKK